MPNYLAALEGLKGLRVPGYTPSPRRPRLASGEMVEQDPTVELYGLQRQRKQELEDRLTRGTGAVDVDRLSELKEALGLVDRDIQASPITTQAADMAGYMGRRQRAIESGYGGSDPVQEQARAVRALAEEKMRLPLREAEITSQSQMDVARQQGQNQLGVEQERSRGALDVQRNYAELQKQLSGQQGGAGNIRSMTMPSRYGGGSMSFTPQTNQKPVSAALLNAVTNARRELEFAKQNGREDEVATRQSELDQALGNVMGSIPADPGIKELAIFALENPALKMLSVSEIAQHPSVTLEFQGDLTPQELQQLDQVLNFLRGLPLEK